MAVAQVFPDKRLTAVQLDLPYRSERNYIHSADIFQALTRLAKGRFASDAYVKSLMLRTTSTRQVYASFEPVENAFGKFSLGLGSNEVHGSLVESDENVLRRVPYDESVLEKAVIGVAPSARFAAPVDGYTAFEHLLVLMKVTSSLGTREAWFCQVNLREPLLDSISIAVTFQYIIHGFAAFLVAQNERMIGSACATLR
ncbi:MAG TPA: hypothetical protein VGI45_34880 [Terracidiphilus sp.]|jgi:hypothetical protein